ncbi:MAG: hypothetical protein AVDCRST_MAG02-4035, partial [uncultured Rubrobacteraceae bacterium]
AEAPREGGGAGRGRRRPGGRGVLRLPVVRPLPGARRHFGGPRRRAGFRRDDGRGDRFGGAHRERGRPVGRRRH